MKTPNTIALAALGILSLGASACSEDSYTAPVIDIDLTDTYYDAAETARQDMYYKPAVGYVGDPMPFYDPVNGDFKILYLQDFRPNQPYTYHPIWGVSTKDGVSYTSLGEVVPTGNASELDAAIGTGCTIWHDGTYYTFYTAHSANAEATGGIGEAVMLATSPDFRTWTKDRNLIISGGEAYSNTDFRDPFVFRGDDGIFHMVVSTRSNGKGVLAEYTSSDLRKWDSAGVFMTMMWDRFYECPDIFKMGEWWYLVYSEQHDAIRRVQYLKGRTLDELKACTADDAGIWPDSHEGFLDSRGLYAGKTASDGTNRYLWGWCASKAGGSNTGIPDWGGNLVAHRLIQHADGSLTLGEMPAFPEAFGNAVGVGNVNLTEGEFRMLPRLGYVNRISFKVTVDGADDKWGVSFGRGSDSERFYSLVVNPEGNGRRKINFEEEGGAGFIPDTDGYVFDAPEDGIYDVTIVTDNSTVSMYVNGIVSQTTRIYGTQRNPWSINCYSGKIRVSDISVSSR